VIVHDWISGKEIAADKATYIIGSDLVPDMTPNVIAFADQSEAEAFRAEHGGKPISFSPVLLAVSPMGMTMPNRVNSAVPPIKGSLSVGVGYMSMAMDNLKMGSDEVSVAEFKLATPAAVKMIPRKMESSGTMMMANYGISDRMALTAKIAELDKTMTSEKKMSGTVVTENSGITDLDLKLRYNLWRDDYYSKFVTLMAITTLPTGDFDTDFITMPGLQMGTGSVNLGAGLLGSIRFGDFWIHGELSRLVNRENSDDYDFGDVSKLGAALHYTPNYDLMLGLELDATDTGKNEYRGVTVDNSGGRAVTLTAVGSWRFLSALGGNFTVNGSYGAPLYQNVNWYGLETHYSGTAMLNFSRTINY